MSLSDRIRPNSEAAPWVIEEVKQMEQELESLRKKVEKYENGLDKIEARTFSWVMNKDNAEDILLVVRPIRDEIKKLKDDERL